MMRKLFFLLLIILFPSAGFAVSGTIPLTPDAGNPVLAHIAEPSIIIEGDTCYMWHLINSSSVALSTATDSGCSAWTRITGELITGGLEPWEFPYVYYNSGDSTYYLLMKRTATGHLYMWSSPDKTTWTALNSGNPVFTKSDTTTDYDYAIYNPAIVFIGSTIHLVLECSKSTGTFYIGYSSSTLAAGPNFNTNFSAPIVSYAGNPWLVHVPDRNALLMIHGDLRTNIWDLRARVVSLAADLSLASSWQEAPGFYLRTNGVHLADPHVAFTTSENKDFGFILQYNYDQMSLYQQYHTSLTLNELYDLATRPRRWHKGILGF